VKERPLYVLKYKKIAQNHDPGESLNG
jgi:hypothetical protein